MLVLLALLGALALWSLYKIVNRKQNLQNSQPLKHLFVEEVETQVSA
jgi:hypothetical protein